MSAKKTVAKKATPKKSAATKLSAASTSSGKARTVIYCHGIGNKPPERKLRSDWDRALFGSDQGERTRMAYWVDRSRYPVPEGPGAKSFQPAGEFGPDLPPEALENSIEGSDSPEESRKFVESLEAELEKEQSRSVAKAVKDGQPRSNAYGSKSLWNPITRPITRIFMADVNDFLFNETKRRAMIQTVKNRIATGGGPFVVVGHSQGSMVAYQALMELGNSIQVDLFVTIGSPLGLPQVTGVIKKWHGKKLPIPPCVKRWVNIARDGDFVCQDQTLNDEYKAAGKSILDLRIGDWDWMPAAHSADYYLSFSETRKAVAAAVDRSRFQRVGAFTISNDLANHLDEDAVARTPVLIELVDRNSSGPSDPAKDYLADAKKSVLSWIEKHIGSDEATKDRIALEDGLSRYVAARLTRAEAEELAASLSQHHGASSPSVYRMFTNSRKKALMRNSIATIQAPTARLGYKADGNGITWGVLDTGIDAAHPHFNDGKVLPGGNLTAAWDCTKRGNPAKGGDTDPHGHGTHVAGIIAGGMDKFELFSVAPKARIVSYKVLGDDGYGNDAWIIKAIDHIWQQNETARRLVIQGVNLSLGGSFDPASFGCGDSPLCSSLLRLIRQGVVVVLAAGNEGSGEIMVDGYAATLSLDLSIGDPANLEDAIAVGSVHPTLPHRYGTSYFSSRGPTADGRLKPDLVAPGERILSCRSGTGRRTTEDSLFVEQSGTSMAAPHVSGLLAAFLSVRREFIGHPERVKSILLENCTDLDRDRYHQGAGLPNLAKMLLHT
jgi:subtilisin family serine protease